MKTVKELYDYLDGRIPRSLSCEWDNDGLMVSPCLSEHYKKILLSLDVTYDTVAYAVDNGYDIIISHHPMIFKALKCINEENFVADKAIKLIKNGVSVFSFHTRLDALCGGVNDAFAEALGLVKVEPFGTDDEMLGRIGELESPVTLEALAERVKTALGCAKVTFVEGKKEVKSICLVGGDGKDFLGAARERSADAYITGSMSYNTMLDAFDMGISVIEAGHFETEAPVLSKLEGMIKEFDPDAVIGYFGSNPIKTL